MPRTKDRARIRTILDTDRAWTAYALGDLSPVFYDQCEWHVPADNNNAIVMILHAANPPILFAHGDVSHIEPLLNEVGTFPSIYLHVRPEIVPVFKARYAECHLDEMWRMVLVPSQYRPAPVDTAIRLGVDHLDVLRRLYSDGESTGESPDFFIPSMLAQGVYFGIRENDELVAAAGTHLIAPEEGVGAVGNVYTRRDRRGRGYAAIVTSAVTSELLRMKLPTIVLCVNQRRETAIRLYERLGYTRHCAFVEGVASAAVIER